jgi:glycosyltransferase involved in cell wall biosynthesis
MIEGVLETARTKSGSSQRFSDPRVAIVHYWLIGMRGGERVVERLLKLFPQADIFTHVYNPSKVSEALNRSSVTTSFINRLPFAEKLYQYYLPLMPIALEGLDLSRYDLVISSESGPAKGVITRPDSTHICYCHSPMRYIWDHYHVYRKEAGTIARLAMPMIYHRLRAWDVSSSARVDQFVANSSFIQGRIRKVWRRESEVIHPPVETSLFTPSLEIEDYYLWVGQMVPYKRPDLAVEAFNANGLPLVMVGTGSMAKSLRARAKPNIKFLDHMDFTSLRRTYSRAKAMIMTAEEDFGITPVEVMASGRPVIAFGRGGVVDSVVPGQTGLFFHEQDSGSLIDCIEEVDDFLKDFDPHAAIEQAARFAPGQFDEKVRQLVQIR